MIGMVLVTHGALADEFRAALEHVVGAQENMASICIGADDNMEKRRQDIVDAIGTVDNGAGVVLLTDMFGGTPSNLAISLLEKNRDEVKDIRSEIQELANETGLNISDFRRIVFVTN